MQALVLVGGEGTRLRPLTLTQPKPAVPLVDRPFIGYMVDWLASHGVDDVVMACGFRAEDLRSALGDGEEGGPRIRYVEESEPLGTAGPIRLAADQGLLGERFCVLNGDLLTDIDLSRTIAAHDDGSRRVATISLYPVADPSAFGLVRRDGIRVEEFLEKPDPGSEAIDTDEVNAGAYVLEREICDLIPAGRKVSIERDVFPRLTDGRLGGVRLEGYWKDIGTPERYLEASWDILEGSVATEVGHRAEAGVLVDAASSVADGATIEGPAWIGPGAVVSPEAIVRRAVVAANVEIGARARVEGSVALAGSRLGADCHIEGAILASDVEVGSGATVPAGAVVGVGARVRAGAALERDARLGPGEEAG